MDFIQDTPRNAPRPGGVPLAVLKLAVLLFAALPLVAADARDVMARMTPAQLDAHIAGHPGEIPELFVALGNALMADDTAAVADYLAAFHREHAKRERDVRVLVSLQLVDPNRFLGEPAFRAKVLPLLPRALDETVSLAMRTAAFRELNELGLTFDEAEPVGIAWGLFPRTSKDRRIGFGGAVRMPDDLTGPIETSIFSINSAFFTAAEAKAFVDAVRKAAPKRTIVVLGDEKLADALKDVTRIETFGRPFTPWPRDPFIAARHAKSGAVLFVNRPNLQPDREEDANMVRALVQAAPFDARWTVAPVPFHNGHVLLTPNAVWISLHSVELRALQLLRIDRVPVETFSTQKGMERYLTAVRIASREYEGLYRRPVKFVHPTTADPELFRKLGGGGGFDLDSLVTMLPQADGSLAALVGDVSLGAKLKVPKEYGAGKVLPAAELDAFVDVVAESLAAQGVKVTRLPLLLVDASPKAFLLNWNNVVLEANDGVLRAEGFASLNAEGDALAKKAFADAGYELTLFPPLIRSVVLGGGYRCASSHIRP